MAFSREIEFFIKIQWKEIWQFLPGLVYVAFPRFCELD